MNTAEQKPRKFGWLHTRFWDLVIAILAAIIAGALLIFYQIRATTADLRYKPVQKDSKTWLINVKNAAAVPAQNVVIQLGFPRPIESHEIPEGIFYSRGRTIDDSNQLEGQDTLTLRCDVVPAHKVYPLVFHMVEASDAVPTVSITSASGDAHAE